MDSPNFDQVNYFSTEQIKLSLHNILSQLDLHDHVYLFCYGSLMWNPEIEYINKFNYTLVGYQRELCIWSIEYRGTIENPGLVFGLMQDKASCEGVVYKIENKNRESELLKVWNREMVTNVYIPTLLPAQINKKPIQMIAFIANEKHPQFTGQISQKRKIDLIKSAHGPRGSCQNYVINTYNHLKKISIQDKNLEKIVLDLNKN